MEGVLLIGVTENAEDRAYRPVSCTAARYIQKVRWGNASIKVYADFHDYKLVPGGAIQRMI